MTIPYLDDLTTEEALDFALDHDETPTAEPGTPGFETAVLCRCLDRFKVKNKSRKPFKLALLRTIRPLAGRDITNEIMADAARSVASSLLQFTSPETQNADETVMASVQITTALLALLKKHETYEKRLRVLDELADAGIDTEPIRRILTASEPTQHSELAKQRIQNSHLTSAFKPNLEAAEAWMLMNPADSFSNDFILNYQSFTSQNINESLQNFPLYIHTFLQAPRDWMYAQYGQMNALAKHTLWITLAIKRSLSNQPEIEEENFESWLRNEANNIQSARQWLDNRVPSVHGSLARVFTALYKRENTDPNWYAGWLRDIDSEFPADNDTFWENAGISWNNFETFWHAEAWRSSNSPSKAVSLLQERLACDSEAPQLWILLADSLIRAQNFGLAEHAVEQAFECPNLDTRVRHAIEMTRWLLGKEALKTAKQAHDIEPALLELAMKHGDPETVAEAALCAFDSSCEPVDALTSVLADARQALVLFIKRLADRRNTEHLDDAYRLCDALRNLCGELPELRFFEAVCQIDNPPIAAQTLEQALRSLHNTDILYWTAVDLWIELMGSQDAWYEAVSGIAKAFASPDPRAVKSLMFLIALLPRAARPMMQSILFETIGPEQTKQIFERAKNPVAEPQTPQISTLDIQELGLSMMPVFWQMLHRVSRLNPPPTAEENARAARRESVLAARGIASSKYEKAPQPAEWIHNTLSKASDAFDK